MTTCPPCFPLVFDGQSRTGDFGPRCAVVVKTSHGCFCSRVRRQIVLPPQVQENVLPIDARSNWSYPHQCHLIKQLRCVCSMHQVLATHTVKTDWPLQFWPIQFWPIYFGVFVLCCGWCWVCQCCCVLSGALECARLGNPGGFGAVWGASHDPRIRNVNNRPKPLSSQKFFSSYDHSSLLEFPRASSADGEVFPQHEVQRDLHVAGRLLLDRKSCTSDLHGTSHHGQTNKWQL